MINKSPGWKILHEHCKQKTMSNVELSSRRIEVAVREVRWLKQWTPKYKVLARSLRLRMLRVHYRAGRAGFHLPGPALPTTGGDHCERNPRQALTPGRSTLIPCTRPRFSLSVLTASYLGNRWGQGQWVGNLKDHAPQQAAQRGGPGYCARGLCFEHPRMAL